LNFLITGGGTGGHIYPALAIASEIKRSYKNANILYVGTKNGLESELVPKEGFEFKTIRVKGLPRKINKNSLIAIRELFVGLKQSKQIIKDFKPDIVIGTGGYVSAPIVYIAAKNKIPAIIHEQNAFPGITNKILSRYVDKVLVTFDEAGKYFKHPDRVVKVGNPIRKEMLGVNKNDAYRKLGIDKNIPFVLSFGGSGGQKKLNNSIFDIIKNNEHNDNFQLLHVTGTRYYDDFMNNLKRENVKLNDKYRILPYFYDMPEALNIADIVITSSGAITLAEISAIGVPSILIPKAYTAENHQEYNARVFEEQGASVLILEKDLNGDHLESTLKSLLNDREKLREMSKNSKKLGKTDSLKLILLEMDKIIK